MTNSTTRLAARMAGNAILIAAMCAGPLPAVLAAEPTSAQKQEAGQRFSRAVELYEEGNFRAALIEFRRANQLAPNWRTLFNIGQVQYQLRNYPAAINAFDEYLSAGGNKIDPARRTVVENDLTKLRKRVATVMVNVNVAGAEVRIDDEVVGTAPLANAIVVSAGRLHITVSKADYISKTKVLDVAGGDNTEIDITLAPRTTAAEQANEDPARPDQLSTPATSDDKDIPWAVWAVAGGFGAAATVFGVLALNSKSSWDDTLRTVTSADALNAERDRTLGFAITSDVLLAGAVLTATIATVMTVSALSSDDDHGDDTLTLHVGPGSLLLRGKF